MIAHFLASKEFPLKMLLNELDKKELLFFEFLTNYEKREDIEYVCNHVEDIEDFFREAKKLVGSDIKKLTKEKLIDILFQQYENFDFSTIVYKSIYCHHSEPEKIFFNTKLLAIERLASLIFLKNTCILNDNFLLNDIGKQEYSLEYFEKKFCLSNRPVLNTLGLVILIGKIDSKKEEISEEVRPYLMKLREMLLCLLFNQFEEIQNQQIEELQTINKKQAIELTNTKEELKRKEEIVLKLRDTTKKLSVEVKSLKKSVLSSESKEQQDSNSEILNQLYNDLRKRDQQIEQLTKELKNIKEKPLNLYQTLIDDLNNQILTLKTQNRERLYELREWKKKVEELQSKSIVTLLQEYIEKEGFTPELYSLIKPYFHEYQQQEVFEQENEKADDTPKVSEQKIGYCLIEDGKHYVVFPDKFKQEIKNLPEATYVGEWQFVKVDADGNFKWLFGYQYDETERDYLIHDFYSIIYRNNEPVMIKAMWDEKKVENLPPFVQLRENQVIAVDAKNQFLRFYRPIRHSIDTYMPSIRAKGHVAYFILKILPNGILVRNIETENEEFKLINAEEKNLKEQQIICMKEEEIVHVFPSSKFYTLSSFYKKAEHGVAEVKDDIVFIRKLSGEVAIVNDIPEGWKIEDGQVLKVDEFNNLLIASRGEYKETDVVERKKISSPSSNGASKKTYTEKIEIKKEVLIIGKITYEISYKMSLYKKGYRAEVIDGYEPWAKIKSALKDKDCVVLVTEYVSHDNMWRIKDENLDIPVIYSPYDGANRIAEQIEALDKQQSAI
jgi:hypothetical protein